MDSNEISNIFAPINKTEKDGHVWVSKRWNVQHLLNKFAEKPIPIRYLISMLNCMSSKDRVWPKVSWMTGIPSWMLYEMVDAQYPDEDHMRQIKYPSAYCAETIAPPPPQENFITPLRSKRASFSKTDLARINYYIKEYFTHSDLNDIHDYALARSDPDAHRHSENRPISLAININKSPKSLKEDIKHKIKEVFNEYDTIEMLPPNLHQRGRRAKLVFDRVNPAVYCIIYGNVLRAKNGIHPFVMAPDSDEEMDLLMRGKNREYAALNLPRITHWKEARSTANINDHMLCRLLRIAPSTLGRWDKGYRAPRNIRIFFELFSQFPQEFITLLIRIQDEIKDALLIKLKGTFPHVNIEYPSPQSEWSTASLDGVPLPAIAVDPKEAPQRKPRRYRGKICAPSGAPEGAYHLAGPVVRSTSGIDLQTYRQASKKMVDLAHLMSQYPHVSKEEWHDLEGIAKIQLPDLVVRK